MEATTDTIPERTKLDDSSRKARIQEAARRTPQRALLDDSSRKARIQEALAAEKDRVKFAKLWAENVDSVVPGLDETLAHLSQPVLHPSMFTPANVVVPARFEAPDVPHALAETKSTVVTGG